jgi:hypothetical protein
LLQFVTPQALCHIATVFAGISKPSYVEAVTVGQPKLTPPKWIDEKRAATTGEARQELDKATIRRESEIPRGQQNRG